VVSFKIDRRFLLSYIQQYKRATQGTISNNIEAGYIQLSVSKESGHNLEVL